MMSSDESFWGAVQRITARTILLLDDSMLYLVLLLAILAFALMGVQQYSLRQHRRGFSLRGKNDPPRRNLFADPEEQRMQQWLESDEEEETELP